MADQGENEERKKIVKALLMRLIIPPFLGVTNGFILSRLSLSEGSRILLIVLISVAEYSAYLIWLYVKRLKIRKKIKKNQARMAELRAQMDEIEVRISRNDKFMTLLEKVRHPLGSINIDGINCTDCRLFQSGIFMPSLPIP